MLNCSTVRYDAIAHTYTAPDGRLLRGITGLLKERLGLGSYDGVSEEVLQRAAERGTEVHRLCEEWDNIGHYPEGNADAEAYVALQADNDLRHVCSEYLVSDGHTYASPIDKVFKRGHVYDLADIKTTYRLDKEYVSWQLSVYAFLFELQNPLLNVGNLYAIHLMYQLSYLYLLNTSAPYDMHYDYSPQFHQTNLFHNGDNKKNQQYYHK